MKVIIKSQMLFIEGCDGQEFQTAFNNAMNDLASRGLSIEEKQISLERHSAVILYTEKTRIPECLKDEYTLDGIFPVCGECPNYKSLTAFKGECPYFVVRRTGSHEVERDEPICDRRWKELERAVKERTENNPWRKPDV